MDAQLRDTGVCIIDSEYLTLIHLSGSCEKCIVTCPTTHVMTHSMNDGATVWRVELHYEGWSYNMKGGATVWRVDIQYTGWRFIMEGGDTVWRVELQYEEWSYCHDTSM